MENENFEKEQPKKWYQKTWGIILLLLIFFPAGLYFLWKSDFSKKSKLVLTGIIAILVFSSMGNKEQNQNITTQNQQVQQSQTESKKSEEVSKVKTESDSQEYAEADIDILINDVKENAARANKSYNGKYVKIVGGVIDNIESDGDYITIKNRDKYSLLKVQCFPKNKEVREQIFNLNKGEYITVYGKISKVGEIMGYSLDLHKIE